MRFNMFKIHLKKVEKVIHGMRELKKREIES